MKIKNYLKSMLGAILCLSLLMPFANVANAQGDSANLIALLKDKQKLQNQAKKFDSSIARLKQLASKSKYDQKDLEIIDSFIDETDDGVSIAVRAQSKAYAAAQNVKSFEDGVKAAARGKDAKAFIESLENNPNSVYEIPGAREAANAFINSVKSDAAVLKTLGDRLKAQGQEPKAQHSFGTSEFVFSKAAFVTDGNCNPVENFLGISYSPSRTDFMTPFQTDPITIALIALAVAYLGVTAARLASGAIKSCVDRAISAYKSCLRRARSDGKVTSFEEFFCRGVYLQDVSFCVLLPI